MLHEQGCSDTDEGKIKYWLTEPSSLLFQNTDASDPTVQHKTAINRDFIANNVNLQQLIDTCHDKSLHNEESTMDFMLSDNPTVIPSSQCSVQQEVSPVPQGITAINNSSYPLQCLSAALAKLRSSSFQWNKIQKSKSPRIACCINSVTISALIDSGAEINVIDFEFARAANLGMITSNEQATAANQTPLLIKGQTQQPVSLLCSTQEGSKMISLGLMLVVLNLGVPCIIGQPGIELNNIICLPKKKLIILAGGNSVHHVSYCSSDPNYALIRAINSHTLLPHEKMSYQVPASMLHLSHVLVTPRINSLSWIEPKLAEVCDGKIYLQNSSNAVIQIKKNDHLADLRSTCLYTVSNKQPSNHIPIHPDSFQFRDFARKRSFSKDCLKQLQVDPDNRLTMEERNLFHNIHAKYVHLFSSQPGKYNGSFGYVDNKLQFATPPAPNARTHIPSYSPSMNQLLAAKMDTLEEWGVLVSPEKVGVTVQFVSPSMLVPKPDSDDLRLVTDFGALNVYLKRVPNTSATIAQARARIAKAKYVVHLDLASYFYQNGMQHSDIQYLGTVHPFKGLKVYTCDPQGLKGASERSYEKLLRIYGDMIQDDRLAQMADGLHVLGNDIKELVTNYEEVLKRADLCNLTFKPSKVCVCPKVINLFGWTLNDQEWLPTEHTTSSLANAPIPTTVKQLRSFLGSFKQLSPSLPNYAATVHVLEKIVAGRKSAERINWTNELNSSFEAAKALAKNPIGLAEPRPSDRLQTFSDYSAETRAVGGRLIILREQEDGTTKELVGGFFSAVLSKHKKAWLPCEGEAAGIRLVLEHFRHHIRESNHLTTHFTDSLPCVLAWRRCLRGAFSASARISAFLTGLSSLPIELRHKSGKLMYTSDYASRHPHTCLAPRCQICSFVKEWENIGDKADNVRAVTVEDIQSGRSIMPLTQRASWKNIQQRDSVHCKLRELILTQQLPETRKTNNAYTKLKLLHNQYTQGRLFIDKDQLIMLRTPEGMFNNAVISVPPSLFPGLMSALHLRLDHPSRTQLSSLVARYFYTPGWKSIIDEISENCHQCAAMKKLPKVLIEDSSSIPENLGSNFAADVIERQHQRILVLKENLSSYVRARLIQNQTADSLRTALLSMLIDIIPDSGTEIRVDAAPGFQTLCTESKTPGTTLHNLKIKISIGRIMNKNKNPTAEIANQELQKEILKINKGSTAISETDLLMALRNMNSRIRNHGYSAKEVLMRRNVIDNQPLPIDDTQVSKAIQSNRQNSSKSSLKYRSKNHKTSPPNQFSIGDLVFLRNGMSKNSPRDQFIVEDVEGEFYLIRKFNDKLRQRLYKVLADELVLTPFRLVW